MHIEIEPISTIIILITAIATILTFFVATLLYEKFGIEKLLKENATLKTIDLLDFLKNHYLSFHNNDLFFSINMGNLLDKKYRKYHQYRVSFSPSFFDAMEPIMKYGNSVIVSKTISEKTQKLSWSSIMYDIKKEEEGSYLKTKMLGFASTSAEQFGRMNDKDMKLVELFQLFDDVKNEALMWLRANCKQKFDLNIVE